MLITIVLLISVQLNMIAITLSKDKGMGIGKIKGYQENIDLYYINNFLKYI